MVPDHGARQRYQRFLNQYHEKKLVILELGIGQRNQLIKAPLMRLVDQEPTRDSTRTQGARRSGC